MLLWRACRGRSDQLLRPHDEARHRHGGVGSERHERRIGAILEQPAHQIGEQVAMPADRCINAAGELRSLAEQCLVKLLAHAVQALEFEAGRAAGTGEDRGDGEGIVGGKLRKQARTRCEQFLRAGHVIEIGHGFPREHRIIGEAALLRAFHFGVPIGALDEPHRETAIMVSGECEDVIDHGGGAFLVGLNGEAETMPAGERGRGGKRRENIEREFEPVGFLGIDGEIQVVGACRGGEFEAAGHELGEHAGARQRLVAWAERRKLDRNPRPVRKGIGARRGADRRDGPGIGGEIALRILGRARPFAEHVEGIASERSRARAHALQGFTDRLAEDEMRAHEPHRLADRRAQRRQADASRKAGQYALRRLARMEDPRAQAERPARSRDEQGIGFDCVMRPIGMTELVFDQPIGGRRVRNPQQRLGEHHQGKALFGGKRIFAQHIFDAAEAGAASGPRQSAASPAHRSPPRAPARERRELKSSPARSSSGAAKGASNAGTSGPRSGSTAAVTEPPGLRLHAGYQDGAVAPHRPRHAIAAAIMNLLRSPARHRRRSDGCAARCAFPPGADLFR